MPLPNLSTLPHTSGPVDELNKWGTILANMQLKNTNDPETDFGPIDATCFKHGAGAMTTIQELSSVWTKLDDREKSSTALIAMQMELIGGRSTRSRLDEYVSEWAHYTWTQNGDSITEVTKRDLEHVLGSMGVEKTGWIWVVKGAARAWKVYKKTAKKSKQKGKKPEKSPKEN